jgi:hypothetical protein
VGAVLADLVRDGATPTSITAFSISRFSPSSGAASTGSIVPAIV